MTRLIYLIANMLCLAPITASAADVAFGQVRATVVQEDGWTHIRLDDPTHDHKAPVGAAMLILEDGLFVQNPDGALTLLREVWSSVDNDWQARKDRLENATVEPSGQVEGITLAQRLAFGAALDHDPRTALDKLLRQDVLVEDTHDVTWEFDALDPAHLERATEALQRMTDALVSNEIRVAGTASEVLLGFFPAGAGGDVDLYWPLDAAARLELAPKAVSGEAFSNESIGSRILIGKPAWFDSPGELKAQVVACLPFGGCGYVSTDAVQPVSPVWVSFDRKTLRPKVLYLD